MKTIWIETWLANALRQARVDGLKPIGLILVNPDDRDTMVFAASANVLPHFLEELKLFLDHADLEVVPPEEGMIQ